MSLEECLKKIRSAPAPANEESTKFHIIAPILRELDWDTTNGRDVSFEFAVGGRAGGRVDIALNAHGRPVAFIEAKNPGVGLAEHVGQVLGYAFHEGVDICALTNGSQWWLYLPREKGDPVARRFAAMDLMSAPIEQLAEDFESFLGKDRLRSGEAEAKAKRVLKAIAEGKRLHAALSRVWEDILVPTDDEIVELVTKRIYKQVSIRPSREQVVAALERKPIPRHEDTANKTRPTPRLPKITPKAPPRRTPQKIEAIMLWGSRYPVKSFTEMLALVVEKLFERHPEKIPDAMRLKRKTISFVTTSPQPPRRYIRMKGMDYFLYCDYTGAQMQKRAEDFLKFFGYQASDLELLIAK